MPHYTILVIDYEPRSVESIRRPLVESGYRVEVARDGVEGMEAFARLHPDVTLIEAMIPKKHGFEVCQELKRTPHGRQSSIVIMTAVYKGRKYRSDALHLYGCDEYLEKPISNEKLLSTIEKFVRERASLSTPGGGNGSRAGSDGRAAPDPPTLSAQHRTAERAIVQELGAALERAPSTPGASTGQPPGSGKRIPVARRAPEGFLQELAIDGSMDAEAIRQAIDELFAEDELELQAEESGKADLVAAVEELEAAADLMETMPPAEESAPEPAQPWPEETREDEGPVHAPMVDAGQLHEEMMVAAFPGAEAPDSGTPARGGRRRRKAKRQATEAAADVLEMVRPLTQSLPADTGEAGVGAPSTGFQIAAGAGQPIECAAAPPEAPAEAPKSDPRTLAEPPKAPAATAWIIVALLAAIALAAVAVLSWSFGELASLRSHGREASSSPPASALPSDVPGAAALMEQEEPPSFPQTSGAEPAPTPEPPPAPIDAQALQTTRRGTRGAGQRQGSAARGTISRASRQDEAPTPTSIVTNGPVPTAEAATGPQVLPASTVPEAIGKSAPATPVAPVQVAPAQRLPQLQAGSGPAKPPQFWKGMLLPLDQTDSPPQPLQRHDRPYPAEARGERGTVVLRVLVNYTGEVLEARLLQGLADPALNAAALRAAQSWKYTPATKNGLPVKVWLEERIPFEP
jgi:TonB family protein